MAAALFDAGVKVNDIYRRLYDARRWRTEAARLALENIELYEGSRIAVTYISRDDFEATGANRFADRGHHRPRAHDRRNRRGRDGS